MSPATLLAVALAAICSVLVYVGMEAERVEVAR